MPGGSVIQGRFPHGIVPLRAASGEQPVQRHAARLAPHQTSFATVGGAPLQPAVRMLMEDTFRESFGDVRVHVGAHPAALGAQAFTHGRHVYFAHGQLDPSSPRGLRMLAHEIAHVAQQRAGRVVNPFRSGFAVVQDPRLEAEAGRLAQRAVERRGLLQAKPQRTDGQVVQPWLYGALAGVAGYAPHLTVGAVGAYLVNSLVERQTGRNVVGHAAYYTTGDPVTREVMDAALQAGIRPYSTQTFNGYTFKIDSYCRTYQAVGTLSRRQGGRTYGAIRPLVKAAGDQNGHIIADSLNGPITSCNFVGMTAYHNNAIGAGPDDDCYSRMEGAVRHILDHETLYVRGKGELDYESVKIDVRLSYPAWNAASRHTKLDYWRPRRLDVVVTGYTGSGESRVFSNPYLGNAIGGHLGVRSIYVGGDFDNTAGGGNRYLIGDVGYPA